jgi:hypothetical protein
MPPPFQVTRAHLKNACDQQNWDLLDKLLEIDASHINDNALFTDTWGSWWGLLFEVVQRNAPDGVRVLLKHGAKRNVGSWGDGLHESPLEVAEGKPAIMALLQEPQRPSYSRRSDPPLPSPEQATADDRAVNRQGAVRDGTGLIFQTEAFVSPPD